MTQGSVVYQDSFVHVDLSELRPVPVMRLSGRRLIHVHVSSASTHNGVRLVIRETVHILVELLSNSR